MSMRPSQATFDVRLVLICEQGLHQQHNELIAGMSLDCDVASTSPPRECAEDRIRCVTLHRAGV